jgi:hypothetical protein
MWDGRIFQLKRSVIKEQVLGLGDLRPEWTIRDCNPCRMEETKSATSVCLSWWQLGKRCMLKWKCCSSDIWIYCTRNDTACQALFILLCTSSWNCKKLAAEQLLSEQTVLSVRAGCTTLSIKVQIRPAGQFSFSSAGQDSMIPSPLVIKGILNNYPFLTCLKKWANLALSQ